MTAPSGSGSPRWRRAVKADIPALSDFLKADEERRVGFSGRLIRGQVSGGALRLPSPLHGAVWIYGVGDVEGALLCHPSRLAFPVFPPGTESDGGLALLAGPFSPASVLGMASDVARYESVFGIAPKATVAYRLMTPSRLAVGRGIRPSSSLAYPGLTLRRASSADLDPLMALQEAYEREEVLTRVHTFNRAACRASLARALDLQLLFLAEEEERLVGKAGTNARGFGVDQVGGVYTMPDRRGRGIASALMTLLLDEIGRSGKKPALFVKPGNAPARALYRNLGFEDIGDYRADYFEP